MVTAWIHFFILQHAVSFNFHVFISIQRKNNKVYVVGTYRQRLVYLAMSFDIIAKVAVHIRGSNDENKNCCQRCFFS